MIDESKNLAGKIVIAMPQMKDPRFYKSVIYICAHSDEGAMGIVLNRHFDSITFKELLKQLDICPEEIINSVPIQFGGPVESGRGFVLHSDEYLKETSMSVKNGIALTATVDVLKSIANGAGPINCLLALGYAGWGPGQLETEIQNNGWLTADADKELIFNEDIDDKWNLAMKSIGIDTLMLSHLTGHA